MWYYRGRIRIKPDWNVKAVVGIEGEDLGNIRIKPDWNVKII